MELKDYLHQRGRGTATDLAQKIQASPSDLVQWAKGKKSVPAIRAVQIEKATGGEVPRSSLRPNDWAEIWPELTQGQTEGAQQ